MKIFRSVKGNGPMPILIGIRPGHVGAVAGMARNLRAGSAIA